MFCVDGEKRFSACAPTIDLHYEKHRPIEDNCAILIQNTILLLHNKSRNKIKIDSFNSMANSIIRALADETVQKKYLMTTVTNGCVIVRSPSAASETAISLSRLSEVQTIKLTYPGLLVVASGLSVVAAAAFCSKEGDGAGIPTAILGISFVASYFLSRKAAVAFIVNEESTRTAFGSLREANKLRKAVLAARTQTADADQELFERPDTKIRKSLSQVLKFGAERANC